MKTLIHLFIMCICLLPVHAQEKTANEPLILSKVSKDDRCTQWVDSVMEKLTLKEKVGQLFVYTIAPLTTKQNQSLLKEAVNTHKVGGLLFSGGKVENQVELTNQAQQMAKVPLMLTFDGEWGLAMRLKETPVFPRNMILGCIRDNRLVYEYGKEMARQCRLMGVHVNFAPVADVNINPNNPVINTRSFGEDPGLVAEKVIAYASGLEEGGVLSVCKHFPGHGDTDTDSHKSLPLLSFSRERLDSVELYPFSKAIQAGMSGVMVGHLQVPALEPENGLPSSLSQNIIEGTLKGELGFKGLVFTDALAMKGVAGHQPLCLKALKAGNDMVLSPPNLKAEIAAVIKAIGKGEISEEEIDRKCRKVLTYKYALGLTEKPSIQLSGLKERINTPQAYELIKRLNLAAITVLGNTRNQLPLAPDTSHTTALLEVGETGAADTLARQLRRYTQLRRFQLPAHLSGAQARQLKDSLAACERIIVAVTAQRLSAYQPFFNEFTTERPVVYLFFTPGKTMLQIEKNVRKASAVVLTHSNESYLQRQTADILFAKATADGRLSASLGKLFKAGEGATITPQTPRRFVPQEYVPYDSFMRQIDSIALEGIQQKAYPGCQIVILKDGAVMLDKAYGTHSGEGSSAVQPTDIYDLASLSKTTGTLLALMKLYDKGLFNLSDKLSAYLPFLRGSNKQNITIREVLYHQSGLPSGIALYPEAIDKESYTGRLFSGRKDARHTVRLGASFWGNPNFAFKKEYVSSTPQEGYSLQIADHLWLSPTFQKEMERKIVEAPMKSRTYRYSDVGFILLRLLAEQLAQMPMDVYLQREFYEPMGLSRTGYLPLTRFPKSAIVPSAVDRFLRKTTLRGFVHDETAAFQGGVSGNAGLFSNAREVAQIYQMLLNQGELNGKRYLSKETCQLFTTEVSHISRRGLGFDKPDTRNPSKSPCCACAPADVYGHIGFTGTCAWVDPVNRLVYVFLSNRIYPDPTNLKLQQLNIREQIQEVIYQAINS